ncbi:MAG: hypothetical protein KIT83_03845 [Bryobacterales bacterium]|nr:hypothetical protein [Bryobacterales bacterium]
MTIPNPVRQAAVAILLCGIVMSALAQIPAMDPRAEPASRSETLRGAVNAEQTPLFVLERTVNLPSGDPRRITLPRVNAGTRIEVMVTPADAAETTDLHNVQVEILRDDAHVTETKRRPSRSAASLQSVLLSTGPWATPIRYQAPWDGHYLVVLRQSNASRAAIPLHVQARLQAGRMNSPEVYTLPPETRTAVAVFSAGLLWTTLLLCGAPIIRAFRSRRNFEEPPWFA